MERSDSSPNAPFDWRSVAPGEEHYQLALAEYCAGRTFPQIAALLEQRGLSAELIPEVTTEVAKSRALFLLSSGKPPTAVRDALVERGLSPRDAGYITREAVQSRQRAFGALGVGKWRTRSLVAGGLLLTAGVILYAASRLGIAAVPGELVAGHLAGGVVLAGFAGVYVMFRTRAG
jgi:hypothetical protein